MEPRRCDGPGCEATFDRRAGKRYCSSTCRANASKLRTSGEVSTLAADKFWLDAAAIRRRRPATRGL